MKDCRYLNEDDGGCVLGNWSCERGWDVPGEDCYWIDCPHYKTTEEYRRGE